jgi:hypothetical protein
MVGRSAVKADASVYKSCCLALNPEEITASKGHDKIKWVPIAEWSKHSKALSDEGVQNRASVAFPFIAVFTLQTIDFGRDGNEVHARNEPMPG